jgi:hypothetical protein
MKVGTKRQATRLLALAAATPVMVVMATGSAGAAPTIKHKLQGVAQTDVVQVSVNVPMGSDLANVLPTMGHVDLSKPLTIGLIHTDGKLVRDQINKVSDLAQSTSTLGAGTLFDKGGLLAAVNRTVTANLSKPHPTSPSGVAFQHPPLQLAVPTLTAKAVPNLLSTIGTGQLAGLSFANLEQLLPAGALDTLNQQLAALIGDPNGDGGAVGTVTNTVDTLLNKIDESLQTTPVGSAAHTALTALENELKALQGALPKLVATLESGSVVGVKALDSGHTIGTTLGNAVSSTAHGALAHLSLLGGFVTLDGFNNSVTAVANGKVGGAKSVINPNLAKVHVGSPVGLNLILGPNGLSGKLLGTDLPAEITGLVNGLVRQISNLLAVAGVKIAQAQYKTTYYTGTGAVTKNQADAQSVSVAGSGLQVLVNSPLARGNSDFSKAMVGVKIGALAASAGDFSQQSGSPPKTVTPNFIHPHTGANLPVTAGAAMVFLTGAYLVRRRMRSSEV